jgi:hypothetical protein
VTEEKNIAQIAKGDIFKGPIHPLLRAMEGMLSMAINEAGLTPPVQPITIQTAKPSFNVATSTAHKVGRRCFQVKKVIQIHLLFVDELF